MSTAFLGLLALLAAPPPTPTATPTATPPINILLSKPNSGSPVSAGTLADFAGKVKLNLPEGGPRVLTNESVKQLSEGIELTTSVGGGPAPLTAGASRDDGKKAMWQQRYRDAVSRVAGLEAEIKRLETEVAGLEQAFYAHDDPFERDGKIKPAWDKALADLRAARSELEEARKGPDEVLNAARRDGALPGWFRGLDQSPAASPPTIAPGGLVAPPPPEPTATPTPRARLRPAGPS